ncbi:hypothetical protein Gotri_012358 [Gossypium trilobum]|uniref:SMP domain-containing protein n=1 Tax=Gossypium trilobum TaxID=34281 RepID=A0A7J9DPX7_9ROSI|nr:hypothetical protein [Gossypium trilobum]
MCHSGSHLVARYGARLPPTPPLVNPTSKCHLHYLKPVTLNLTLMPSLKPSTVTAFSHEFHTKEMSQGQPIKPQADQLSDQEGIKYGDVFDSLDTGAGAVMYSAAAANLRAGAVGPDESNEMVEREDVAVSKSTDAQGKLLVNEAIADHATVLSVGDKPVDQGDAAAIRVAEARAASSRLTQHSGLGTRAQAAATFNDRASYGHNKITISDVLSDASEKLPTVKAVTNEDAEEVRGAEQRNKADMIATAGGVADTMATAANGSTALFATLTPVIPRLHRHHGCLPHRTSDSVLKAPYAIPSAATLLDCFPFSLLTSQFNTHYAKHPINETMSQQQPRRPKPDHSRDQEPIKYSDVFNVTGELASKPIAPEDAAAMQSAETRVLGQTRKSGPAAVMESAAAANEMAGLVRHDQANVTEDEGVTVTKTNAGGEAWITEAVEGQVVGQYIQPEVPAVNNPSVTPDPITVGEALETAALSAADKAVELSDVAAIQAAERRATGINETLPGGVAAEAQCAATRNARTMRFEDKTTLSDVLSDATTMLPRDKAVTPEDADRVVAAELRNNPYMSTAPGGVAASMAAAARLNQNSTT